MKIRLLCTPDTDVQIPDGQTYRLMFRDVQLEGRGPTEWIIGAYDLNPVVFQKKHEQLSERFRTKKDAADAWENGFVVVNYEMSSPAREIVKQLFAEGTAAEVG